MNLVDKLLDCLFEIEVCSKFLGRQRQVCQRTELGPLQPVFDRASLKAVSVVTNHRIRHHLVCDGTEAPRWQLGAKSFACLFLACGLGFVLVSNSIAKQTSIGSHQQ